MLKMVVLVGAAQHLHQQLQELVDQAFLVVRAEVLVVITVRCPLLSRVAVVGRVVHMLLAAAVPLVRMERPPQQEAQA
jgi:hypothetical protein